MCSAGVGGFVGVEQLLFGVEPNGFEQPIPAARRIVIDHAAFDQRPEGVDGIESISCTDAFDRLQSKRSHEYCQAAQEHALLDAE